MLHFLFRKIKSALQIDTPSGKCIYASSRRIVEQGRRHHRLYLGFCYVLLIRTKHLNRLS